MSRYEIIDQDGRVIVHDNQWNEEVDVKSMLHTAQEYTKRADRVYQGWSEDLVDVIPGEVITKPTKEITGDSMSFKAMELRRVNEQLEKAEAKLARYTKTPKPKNHWVPPDDKVSMTIKKCYFGWYSAWITAFGPVPYKGTRFYARNPRHAYLICRRANRRLKDYNYYVSTEIRFVGF